MSPFLHRRVLLVMATLATTLLVGCGTPHELKRPVGRPTMGAIADPDPLPAYVTPQPEAARTEP